MLVGPRLRENDAHLRRRSILDQDAGECLLFGQDLRRLSKKERVIHRGKNVGFVFQTFNLIPPDGRRECGDSAAH